MQELQQFNPEQVSKIISADGKVISELSKHVKANGGGQPFYATAGGDYLKGIKKLSDASLNYLKKN